MEQVVLWEAALAHEIDEQYALQKATGKVTFPVDSKQEIEKYKEIIQKKVEKGYFVLVSLYIGAKKAGLAPISFLEGNIISNDQDKLTNNIEEGLSLSDCFNLDDATLEQLYHLIHPLFANRLWLEASDALFLLTLLAPDNPTFLHALGHTEYELGRFDKARSLYATAYLLNPENSVLLHEVIDCCEKLGDPAGKEECLKLLDTGG